MRLTFSRGPAWVAARVSGEIDLSSAQDFRTRIDQVLRRTGIPNLILCLEDLDFIDSTGLGSMLGRHRHITASGGKMIIVNVPPRVLAMIEMAGLSSVFSLARTHQEALRVLGKKGYPSQGGACP